MKIVIEWKSNDIVWGECSIVWIISCSGNIVIFINVIYFSCIVFGLFKYIVGDII